MGDVHVVTHEGEQWHEEEGTVHDTRPWSRKVWRGVREIAIVLALAIVISLVVKTWLVQAFYIPSGSMEDTLLVGDRVIVNKFVPTFSPLDRGDIVVFEDPGGWLPPHLTPSSGPLLDALHDGLVFIGLAPASDDYLIKRVIGLPGDTVACVHAGAPLTVNGVPIEEPYVRPGDQPSAVPFSITVPEGHIWVMGDHRSNSEDSRFHDPNGDGQGGSVAIDKVAGRAFVRVWPIPRWGSLDNAASVFSSVPGRHQAGQP